MSIKDWIYRVIGNESDAPLAIDDEAEEPVAYRSGDVCIVRNTGNAITKDGGSAVSGIDYT